MIRTGRLTNDAYDEYAAWLEGFGNGYVGSDDKEGYSYYVRCVRGGQSRLRAPSGLAAKAISPTQITVSWKDRAISNLSLVPTSVVSYK